jgi:biopolymer transport protein ExbB/TolQ
MSEWFRLGGVVMWPLLACSAVLAAFVVERGWAAFRGRLASDAGHPPIHRRVLLFFVEVAPALGLLGTMQGIMESFSVLGGQSNGRQALTGLGVACITTVFALLATVAGFLLDFVSRPKEVVQP